MMSSHRVTLSLIRLKYPLHLNAAEYNTSNKYSVLVVTLISQSFDTQVSGCHEAYVLMSAEQGTIWSFPQAVVAAALSWKPFLRIMSLITYL